MSRWSSITPRGWAAICISLSRTGRTSCCTRRRSGSTVTVPASAGLSSTQARSIGGTSVTPVYRAERVLRWAEVLGGVRERRPFGNIAFAIRARVEGLRDLGPALSPQNAFYFLQGLETLSLRADRHIENTVALATWLGAQPGVVSVNYPGLPEHPHYAYAQAHFPRGVGSVLTFEVEGGRDAGRTLLDSVNLTSRLVNLGDAKTSITHPASTTHAQLAPVALEAAGVSAEC